MNKATSRRIKEIRRASEEWMATGRRVVLAGIGAATAAAEASRNLFDALVDEGSRLETRERARLDRAFDRVTGRAAEARDRVEGGVQEAMAGVLHRFGVPTRRDIEELRVRVEQLGARMRDRARID